VENIPGGGKDRSSRPGNRKRFKSIASEQLRHFGIIRHGDMILPRATTFSKRGEILALVDDPAREQLAKNF